jgi:hypothetical protein
MAALKAAGGFRSRALLSALAIAAVAAGTLAPVRAWSHHEVAAFDRNHPITLTGTAKEFRLVNPHAWLYLDVPNGKGGSDEKVLEGASVAVMARYGWTSKSIRPGDKVRVVVAPRRNGQSGGQVMSVTMTDTGQVLQLGGQMDSP